MGPGELGLAANGLWHAAGPITYLTEHTFNMQMYAIVPPQIGRDSTSDPNSTRTAHV